MKDCESACFVCCARRACSVSGLEDLKGKAGQLAAPIKKNFEVLGV